jgi:hypothetical protein
MLACQHLAGEALICPLSNREGQGRIRPVLHALFEAILECLYEREIERVKELANSDARYIILCSHGHSIVVCPTLEQQ